MTCRGLAPVRRQAQTSLLTDAVDRQYSWMRRCKHCAPVRPAFLDIPEHSCERETCLSYAGGHSGAVGRDTAEPGFAVRLPPRSACAAGPRLLRSRPLRNGTPRPAQKHKFTTRTSTCISLSLSATQSHETAKHFPKASVSLTATPVPLSSSRGGVIRGHSCPRPKPHTPICLVSSP